MASMVLGIAGSVVGGFLGGPIGASIGGMLGSAIGGLVDNMLFKKGGNTFQEGPRLGDLSVMSSNYGTPIPRLYGPQNRLALNIFWTSGIQEDYHDETQTAGGKGGGGQSVTNRTYTYRVSIAGLIGAGPLVGISRIWANKRVIYDHGAFNEMQEVRFYPGDGAQAIDPDIESVRGVGNTPAYRHSAYVLLKNLKLADFGNAIPQLEVECVAQTSITVGAVIQDICEACGVENVSANNLTQELRGYAIGRSSNAIDAIQPLALAYNFDAAEQRGSVRMIARGLGLKAVIPAEDMGVVTAGSERPASPINFERGPDFDLPRKVTVSYSDPDFDFQQSSQSAARSRGNSANDMTQSLPIVLDADTARAIADRLMYEAWAGRRTANFPLSDHWIGLSPADVIGIQFDGTVVPFKMTRATRGQDGVTEVEARYEDSEVYTSAVSGASAILPVNVFQEVGDTLLFLFNAPLLIDENDDNGFYWACNGVSSVWRGGEIQRSTDGGDSYLTVSGAAVRAKTGVVAAALPSGPWGYIDEANSVTVVLDFASHTLSGATEGQLFSGSNTFWLGNPDGSQGEVISFRDATLITPGTYELTGLLRGRRGTDNRRGDHGTDESFILLSRSTVGRSDYGVGDWNAERIYRAVSVLQEEADAPTQTFTNTGERQRPFSPVHVTGSRDGSNNLTIDWIRRTRLSSNGLAGPVPLGEEVESYEVDVWRLGVVVRTIATSTATAAYSAAFQTADGFTPGDPVTIDVYQLSTVRGRGHARRAVI